jgi:cytochrome o ubiquinol oxidase subunit 3
MKETTDNKVTFGFWVYLMSDCVLFAGLFATYAVLQSATFGGPSITDIFDLPFVLAETLLLLTSSFTVGLALVAARMKKKKAVLAALTATLLLGFAFLGMEVSEFTHLVAAGEGPSRSAFLSAFFTLVGTHGLHVFFGSLWMIVVVAHLMVGGITQGALRKLTCVALFWHFLDIIWIFIFTFVYLMGALAL